MNGQSVPEPSLNTWLAGSFGAPVVMLSGDNYVIEQARPVLGDIEYAQLKTSTGFFSGDHLPIDKTRPLLRETAARAVANAGKISPVICELPVTIEVDLSADPVNDPALGQRGDDNARFIDLGWEKEKAVLSDIDLILATHPETSSPKTGTISFTCSDYQTAYRTLHSILLEIYERDIENLIDDIADVQGYARPGLEDIVYPDYPMNEIGPQE